MRPYDRKASGEMDASKYYMDRIRLTILCGGWDNSDAYICEKSNSFIQTNNFAKLANREVVV